MLQTDLTKTVFCSLQEFHSAAKVQSTGTIHSETECPINTLLSSCPLTTILLYMYQQIFMKEILPASCEIRLRCCKRVQ